MCQVNVRIKKFSIDLKSTKNLSPMIRAKVLESIKLYLKREVSSVYLMTRFGFLTKLCLPSTNLTVPDSALSTRV